MRNRLKVTKNTKARSVTLVMQRRDSWGNTGPAFQFTISERELDRALLNAQIIAPWNRVAK